MALRPCYQRWLRSAMRPGARSADLPRGRTPDAVRSTLYSAPLAIIYNSRECLYSAEIELGLLCRRNPNFKSHWK
jgi:hypothetical protein